MKKFKKIIGLILSVLMLSAVCVSFGCSKSAPTLDKSSVTMYVFETQTITLNTESDDAIKWTSTNENVVSLKASGKSAKVTALSSGEATVIVKQGDTVLRCKVTVFPSEKQFGIQLDCLESVELGIGDTYQISASATIDGQVTNLAKIVYELENASPLGAITVDDSGKVEALAKGTALIKVYAVFGDEVSNVLTVSVTCFPDDYNNNNQQIPSLDGGLIEDVFGE